MIRQVFGIERYGWEVEVWYAVDCYYLTEIMNSLMRIGCRGGYLRQAYENLSACRLDTGLTYSDYGSRKTVMVIAMSSCAAEFENSLNHERKHLLSHIEKTAGIDPWGEEAAYLAGDVSMKMFPVAGKFLCDGCRRHLCGRGNRTDGQRD